MQPDDDLNSNRRSVLKAAGLFGAFFGSSGVASASEDADDQSTATELLVGVSASVPDTEAVVARALSDGDVVHTNETLHYATIELPENTPDEAKAQILDALEGIDDIEYVEENATLESFETPNDPYYSQQYAPQQVDCDGAWDRTWGDSDVVLSIVDQGVQYDHENIAENMDDRIGAVFAGRGSDPYPVNSSETHGTIVGGIAGAGTNNGTGQAGVSNCSMLSARALNANGAGSLADIADAIQWSADQGADVINLSLGSASSWRTLANACSYAYSQDCLLVAAAGNEGGRVSYPAAYNSVVAVSAITSNDRLASYSNRGPEIDLTAPGSGVLSTTLYDNYTYATGTSMAAPVVAGVAGLVRSRFPDLSSEELREHLQETATDIGLSSYAQGHGRVDAGAAVNTVPDGHEPDDGNDEDEQDDGDDGDELPNNLLAVVTEPDAYLAEYEFTADGPVEFADAPYESPSGGNIEGGTYSGVDTIDEDDGTWDVSGITGGGHGDAFTVDGPVTSIDLDQPDVTWLELGGERLSPEEIIKETGGDDEDDEDDDDDLEQPAPPEELEAVAVDETRIELEWQSDPNAASYVVAVDGDAAVKTTDAGATVEDLEPETTYELGVSAVGPDGVETDPATLEVTTDAAERECGTETETTSTQGTLTSGWWGYRDRWTYSFKTDEPCELTISIDGPANADFDLYVRRDGSYPSRSSYHEASTGSGADEAVTIDVSDDDSVTILVYAEDGSGSYRLTIDEKGR
ncbi:peptidase S8 [Salinadaptatus halalkaliphilus]|uniref:Peptidase S8 n=1 Tax=Salinadaptatus halalkaliphilus TaxID=2419781 RepID=A0A4S3THG6_9EURY|nr:S8 family serine peptidase [Salinadaptatus halalkaliphilus]THE63332.1 peptidase S8 [Salinadaptatus halalkaliphilus]